MQASNVEPEVEELARELISAGGADPDTIVQPGRPVLFGTPHGEAVKVDPTTFSPLWRFYIPAAELALRLARKQIEARRNPAISAADISIQAAE